MAQLMKRKLKGSTLIEVTVASVIIVVVFLLVSTLIANLWKAGPTARKLSAHSFLQQKADHYVSGEDNKNEESLPEGLKFEQKEEPYEGYADIKQVTLTLRETGSDRILDELMFLLKSDEQAKD